jgi:hypothetical protein
MIAEMHNFNHMIEDDVSFGLFVEQYIPIAFENNLKLAPFVFYTHTLCNNYNSNVNDFIHFEKNNDLNYIIYRNKTANRHNDVKIMSYICDNILSR